MKTLPLRSPLLFLLLSTLASARQTHAPGTALDARQWIAPTARSRAFATVESVHVTGLAARVRIDGLVAHTTLRVALANASDRPAEAELLLPVPDGAVIDHFDFQGGGSSASARLLAADEARRTYDEIVARLRDPALLEFAGAAAVRSSVFPVPAGSTQTIELGYHELLPHDGARVDYELLRSAALGATVPLDLELEVLGDAATVYSPTHALQPVEQDALRSRYRADASLLESGSFRCAVLSGTGPRAALYACPDEEGPGGTFLLFAGVSPRAALETSLAREVTVVLDRSGSMAGQKFEQARTAALQVLEGLRAGESFRIVDYSDAAAASSNASVTKSPESIAAARAYLAGLTTGGGTNVAAALSLALAPSAAAGTVPVVLFLTDGRPTVGAQSELELRALVQTENHSNRRLFTFGVGHDVNAPLLDHLALGSRATSSYVRPGEDVERVVGALFRRLSGPVMAGLELAVRGADGAEDATLLRDLVPQQLPDLFAGEQLVLVGRYTAARALTLEIRARSGGEPLRLTADLARASRRNEFVPRLWATRRVGELTDAIRQVAGEGRDTATLLADSRTRELADEILRLSLQYGILSEFTSFLAREGSPLVGWSELEHEARANLVLENERERTGALAVQIGQNNMTMQQRNYPNNPNVMLQGGQLISTLSVAPVQHGALFQRGTEWIEGRVLSDLGGAEPARPRTVVIGSDEHRRLVDELVEDGRADIAAQERVLFRHRGELVRQVPFAPAAAPRR